MFVAVVGGVWAFSVVRLSDALGRCLENCSHFGYRSRQERCFA